MHATKSGEAVANQWRTMCKTCGVIRKWPCNWELWILNHELIIYVKEFFYMWYRQYYLHMAKKISLLHTACTWFQGNLAESAKFTARSYHTTPRQFKGCTMVLFPEALLILSLETIVGKAVTIYTQPTTSSGNTDGYEDHKLPSCSRDLRFSRPHAISFLVYFHLQGLRCLFLLG